MYSIWTCKYYVYYITDLSEILVRRLKSPSTAGDSDSEQDIFLPVRPDLMFQNYPRYYEHVLGVPRFSLMALVQRNPIGDTAAVLAAVGLFSRGVKIVPLMVTWSFR